MSEVKTADYAKVRDLPNQFYIQFASNPGSCGGYANGFLFGADIADSPSHQAPCIFCCQFWAFGRYKNRDGTLSQMKEDGLSKQVGAGSTSSQVAMAQLTGYLLVCIRGHVFYLRLVLVATVWFWRLT